MPLDNLKNVGKSIARGIVGKNLTRVAGGIAGLIGGPNRKDSSDISPLRSSTSTTTLSFPLDNTNVDPSLGNHGHYMMFFINEQESAKVRFDNMQDKLSVDGETLGTRNLKRHFLGIIIADRIKIIFTIWVILMRCSGMMWMMRTEDFTYLIQRH